MQAVFVREMEMESGSFSNSKKKIRSFRNRFHRPDLYFCYIKNNRFRKRWNRWTAILFDQIMTVLMKNSRFDEFTNKKIVHLRVVLNL